MYNEMTREELIEQLRMADEEINRLRGQNTRLVNDYNDAKRDADHWHGMYLDLVNKAAAEESHRRRAEERRLVEWNDWASRALPA